MRQLYWLQQDGGPLFPKLLWSRPEGRNSAGKLLVVGGTKQSFATPANAFVVAQRTGAGSVHLLLPNSLEKTVRKLLPEASFAPSTQSGSFARPALAEMLSEASWADATLLCDDLGNNSETLALLEAFLHKHSASISMSVTSLTSLPPKTAQACLLRQNTLIYGNYESFQKLFRHTGQPVALTSAIGTVQLVEALHNLNTQGKTNLLCTYQNTVFIASESKVSTTPTDKHASELAVGATVWWLQNPTKPFEAITSSFVADD